MEDKNDNNIKIDNKEENKEEDIVENKEDKNEENKNEIKDENKEDKKEEIKEDNNNENEENNRDNKGENKVENKNKEDKKEEIKEDYKEEDKEDKNEEQKKDDDKENNIENIIENKEEKEEENKDESQEGKDIIKEENKVENKEENNDDVDKQIEDDNKEKNKILNEEENNEKEEKNEDDKNINNKDDANSESFRDDKSNTSSNLHLSTGFQRFNSENEMDKIISGVNESQINLINSNININIDNSIKIEEKKEEEEKEEEKEEENKKEEKEEENKKEENKKEEIENENVSNILGDIFRNVVKVKSKKPKENLRMSLYRKNLDNEPKDFGSFIKDILNEIKQNTLNFLDKTMKEFDKRYNEYIEKINKYINENEIKMSKLLKNKMEIIENEYILDFADNHLFENFENIFEIHQNLFDSIEEHIELLKIFLEQSNLIKQKNPLECYINNHCSEILNSWFLNKIDLQKLDLSKIIKNQDLSDLCSKYICKKKDNNFSSLTIKKEGKEISPFESYYIKENLNNLKKMNFIQMKSNDINSLFKVINTNSNTNTNSNKSQIKISDSYPSAEKLSSLSLINSDLSSNDLNKINSPSLSKLKLKRSNLSLNLKSFFGNIIGKTLSLEKLYLQKCFMDNESLSDFIEFLSEAPKVLESLQFLNLSGNDFTKVDLTTNFIKKQCSLKNLQYLDCSKNNIFDFSQENFQAFPQLKVLDLTDNNMSNHLFFDNIKKLPNNIVLLSNNLFLNNNKKNAEDYREYLNNKLMQFEYKIKKLDLSFLYNRKIIDKLFELKFSPIIKISLVKLNLSYCGLNDINATKFLQSNYGLLNLKELNLSNNFITMEIFNLLLKNEVPLDNLYSLDLSFNDINSVKLDDYKQLELFVLSSSKLKKIKLQETKFVQELLVLTIEQKIEMAQINQRLSQKGIKFIVEKENEVLTKPLESLSLFEIKDKEMDTY